jgi:hypothetical protein
MSQALRRLKGSSELGQARVAEVSGKKLPSFAVCFAKAIAIFGLSKSFTEVNSS